MRGIAVLVFAMTLTATGQCAPRTAAPIRRTPSPGMGLVPSVPKLAPGLSAPLLSGLENSLPLPGPASLALESAAVAAPLPLPDAPGLETGLDELSGVGILTVDLKDSTRLYRKEGVKRGYRVVSAYLDFAAQIARKHGGAAVRHRGDGYLFLFDGSGAALEAAVELQSRVHSLRAALPGPGLAFRAGVSGGRVLVHRRAEGLDAYGQSLERALKDLEGGEGDDIVLGAGLDRGDAAAARLREIPVKRSGILLRAVPAPAPESRFADALPGAQRALTRASIVERATMFAALKDWSDTYDEFGRAKSYASIRAFQDYLQGIAAQFGGGVVKTEGEGVMLTFASAAGALRAAAAMQRRIGALRSAAPLGERMEILIGASYGRAVIAESLEGIDFFGNTVNAAARLMKRARGSDIVISRSLAADPEAARLLADGAATREDMELKGFAAPVATFRVAGESGDGESVDGDLARRLARGVENTLKAIRRLRGR